MWVHFAYFNEVCDLWTPWLSLLPKVLFRITIHEGWAHFHLTVCDKNIFKLWMCGFFSKSPNNKIFKLSISETGKSGLQACTTHRARQLFVRHLRFLSSVGIFRLFRILYSYDIFGVLIWYEVNNELILINNLLQNSSMIW